MAVPHVISEHAILGSPCPLHPSTGSGQEEIVEHETMPASSTFLAPDVMSS